MSVLIFYFRVFAITLWLFLTCLGVLLILPFRWGNPNGLQYFARTFGWGALPLAGIRLKIEGRENLEVEPPAVFLGNHQSAMDMATFGAVRVPRCTVVIKKEVQWIPIVGQMFMASAILIDRKKGADAREALKKAVALMKAKRASVGMFPEGTRNRTREGMLPFKKGAFHLAIEAQVPIVPIVCGSLNSLIDPKKKIFRGGELRIRVLPPVSTAGLTRDDLDSLIETVRSQMLKTFEEIS